MPSTTENIYVKMQIDTKQFDNSMTGIKREMAALRGLVGNSLLSPQDNNLLKARLGQLKNNLDDVKAAANNIDVGDVFGNMAKFGSVAANAVAGVTGAMSLLGVESGKVGEVEKKILQFMAIGNALQAVADSKRLGSLAAIYGQKIKDLFLTRQIAVEEKVLNEVGAKGSTSMVGTSEANAAANVAQLISIQEVNKNLTSQTELTKLQTIADEAEIKALNAKNLVLAKNTTLQKLQNDALILSVDGAEELEVIDEAIMTTQAELNTLQQKSVIATEASVLATSELNAAKSKQVVQNVAQTTTTEVLTTATNQNTVAQGANNAAQVSSVGILGKVSTAFMAGYRAVKAFTIALLTNPITIFIASLVALGAAVYGLYKLFTDLSDAEEENLRIMKAHNDEMVRQQKILQDTKVAAEEAYIPQRILIDKLTKTINDNTISIEKRKEALQKLINLDPNYLKGLTLQNINTQEGITILNNYKTALNNKAKAMALEAELVKLYSVQYQNNLALENLLLGEQALLILKGRAGGDFGMNREYKERIDLAKEDIKLAKEKVAATDSLIERIQKQLPKQEINVEFNTGDLIKETKKLNDAAIKEFKISEAGKWDWALMTYNRFLYDQEQLKQKAREESNAAELKALEEEEDKYSEIYKRRMDAKIRAALDELQMINEANENAGLRIYNNTLALDQKFVEQRKQVFGGLFTVFDDLNFDEKLAAFSELAQAVTQITVDSIYAIMEVQSAKNDELFEASMNRVSEQYDAVIKQIDDAVKYGSLTQQEADKRKESADKERIAKENKLKAEQSKVNKEIAIRQATISTAQAIVSALAQPPGVPITIPYGILAGVLGGIQIAAIKATPIQQYGLGGSITGLPHSLGGVPIVAEGGEFVVKKSVAQAPGMGDFLNKVNTGQIQPTQSSGGFDVDMIEAIVKSTISGVASIPVINVESDSTRVQRKVMNIESKSNW